MTKIIRLPAFSVAPTISISCGPLAEELKNGLVTAQSQQHSQKAGLSTSNMLLQSKLACSAFMIIICVHVLVHVISLSDSSKFRELEQKPSSLLNYLKTKDKKSLRGRVAPGGYAQDSSQLLVDRYCSA